MIQTEVMTSGEKRKRCTCDGQKKRNAERMNDDRQASLDACDQCCGKGKTGVSMKFVKFYERGLTETSCSYLREYCNDNKNKVH